MNKHYDQREDLYDGTKRPGMEALLDDAFLQFSKRELYLELFDEIHRLATAGFADEMDRDDALRAISEICARLNK